jgi:hypothetical protein
VPHFDLIQKNADRGKNPTGAVQIPLLLRVGRPASLTRSRPALKTAHGDCAGLGTPGAEKAHVATFQIGTAKTTTFSAMVGDRGVVGNESFANAVFYFSLGGGRNLMVTSSRYLLNGSPTRCTFCNAPFRVRNGFVEFWRASNGDHFCSEFCADDAEEAHFRKRRAAAPSVAAPTTHSTRL